MYEQAVSLYLPLVLTRQQLISVDMPLREAELMTDIKCTCTYSEGEFVTTPEPDTRNCALVIFTKHNHRTKRMFTHLVQPLEESYIPHTHIGH
jgi:hypothetical protein